MIEIVLPALRTSQWDGSGRVLSPSEPQLSFLQNEGVGINDL